ncbi:hypothetical protein CC78DRAFT_544008 [Lojkania enalia]|uniref:Uncharacterized protein n=1 Tax=Lojkania enalia TaxID=147567 RepID=A0A9P4K9A6_9PLEO|nr:hypothetical protein CC78DRAFT_544008 [Didymosphaeria enalia]
MDPGRLSPDNAKGTPKGFGAPANGKSTIPPADNTPLGGPQGFGASITREDPPGRITGNTHQPHSSEELPDTYNASTQYSTSYNFDAIPRRYSQDGHEADVSTQHLDDRSPSPSSTGMKKGEYGLVDNLQSYQFDGDNRSLLSKRYDHHESRKFLFKTGFARFFITLLFCLLIGLSLRAYEGFTKPRVISKTNVRVFNALMLGLSLGLGLNLASSLKRYAVILRWSLLTKRYVSLEVFDLILGVETLTKVGKLMIISLPGIRKVKWLKHLPWFREARDDGTRLTWILCLLWLLINIGAQVLVAALSLFWPVDPSDAVPLLTYGSVTVSDLALWAEDPPQITSNASALFAANTFGQEASDYPSFSVDSIQLDSSTVSRNPIYNGSGYYEYRFVNRNPDHEFTNYFVSSRKVQTRASCVQLETDPDFEDPDDSAMFAWGSFNGDDWDKYYLPSYVRGSISWIGSVSANCGPRCTNLTVYQTKDSRDIKNPSLFLCNSTVSEVTGGEEAFSSLQEKDKSHIFGTDEFARIASGAIAWTGYTMNSWRSRQTRVYLRGSKWSPYEIVRKEQIEDLIARFTIGAIAAFDDHGIRYVVPEQNTRPVQGQRLTVDWGWVLGLLGGICIIQLGALLALLALANKSIIRDESFFSLAMLLSPVVNRIGKEGMNMSGEEIKQHRKLMWKRIRYDYREGKEGEPHQVDIFFQGRDMAETRRSWVNGQYI